MQVTNDERLALLTALDKRIAPVLRDAKADARRELIEAAQRGESDRKPLLVGGVKVGEVAATYSKAAPEIAPGRRERALDYLRQLGLVEESPRQGWETHFERVGAQIVCRDTGEPVDFLDWQPKAVRTAAVRGCDPAEVLDAFGGRVESMDVAGLLEGSD